jgi:glyoxylase-like metal-dependent hydrolase (beta-lactamase superfamily II)
MALAQYWYKIQYNLEIMKNGKSRSAERSYIPMTSISSGKGVETLHDVFCYTNQIVNVIMLGHPDEGNWIMVDAGMPQSGQEIISVAKNRFGAYNPPKAIVLTHGHFDHVGGILDMVAEWGTQVYAHPFEFPFLTGEKKYPKPDPSVDGGLLAKISFIYPTRPIDIKDHLSPLPGDHSVPEMPDWVWVPSAGHSPGHVSFYRAADRTLISGDAFITVRQDSLYKVLIQKEEVNGPPRYLTTDWQAAWESVRNLELLQPALVLPGHGQPMAGDELREGLKTLVDEFDRIAIPDHGRYVDGK